MGYWKDSNGVKCFFPDNDENTLYLSSGAYSFIEIQEQIKNHFGENVNFDKLTVSAEHVHTNCIGYDRYDPWDYTDYIVIKKRKIILDGICDSYMIPEMIHWR